MSNASENSKPDLSHDPGLDGLVIIARFHDIAADAAHLKHLAATGERWCTPDELALLARSLGMKTRTVTVTPERLLTTPMPALALRDDGRHTVVAKADATSALVVEAFSDQPTVLSAPELISRCAGRVMVFTSQASLVGDLARFDFTWFVPAIVKYRRLLLEVLGVSAVIQVFGLVTPLMFQVVMDKVLVNRAFSTLNVVCVALFLSAIFEVLLTGLRNYVFAHTTNRIDVELGTRLFRHLLALPLAYFNARRVGDTVARVRELENIRSFLTGQALTALIDALFSVLFLGVMCLYSVKLTLMVAASLPCYAAISLLLNPVLRRRLGEKFSRGADNQSFLVETVSAAETVKSTALEPQFTRRWDNLLARYVSAGFRAGNVGNLGQQLIQLVGKLVTLLILFFGAGMVIDAQLSVGGLIAFNMMAQRVAAPVLRLAQLWQDFQQVGISMQRLGDILNARSERPSSRQVLPAMKGAITFEHVRFRYRLDGEPILDGISLEIEPGQVIGIVGRSGSGKSTLTKLVQRLYQPESGRIRVDGIDLALADPVWLRRHIGVVLQENILFNRTIRENISITDPAGPLDKVIAAAKLAGAHEFISELPEGYETMIEEHGSNFSGGQRQRLAIARALVTNPRILIFDEATSALDFETEHIVRSNMKAMSHGRTVIVIAHRLSAVRDSDAILVMEKGRISERGTHAHLMAANGVYARLASFQAEPSA